MLEPPDVASRERHWLSAAGRRGHRRWSCSPSRPARPGRQGDGPGPGVRQRRAPGRRHRARAGPHHRPRPQLERAVASTAGGAARPVHVHLPDGAVRSAPDTAAPRRRTSRSAADAGQRPCRSAAAVRAAPAGRAERRRDRRRRGVRARGRAEHRAWPRPGWCWPASAVADRLARSRSPTGSAPGWSGPPGARPRPRSGSATGDLARPGRAGRPDRTAARPGGVQLHGRPGRPAARRRAGAGRRPVAPAAHPADRAAAKPARSATARRRADPGRGRPAGARGRPDHPHRPARRRRRAGPAATPPR